MTQEASVKPFPALSSGTLARTQVPRKIAHLTSVHPPFDVRIFHKECKSIARAGYDVTLVACHENDEIREGIRIRGIGKASGRLSRMIRGVWAVYKEAIRLDAELYHFHDPELLPIGLLLRMRGKIVVYDVHEDVSVDVAQKHYIPQGLRHLSASAVSLLETVTSGFFSAVVPATPTISRRFGSRDRQVVVSNYPAVEDLQVIPGKTWSRRGAAIAYVGVLSRDRCIIELVEAMSMLPKDRLAILRLAGRFSPSSLQDELAGTKGWERVEVLGVLDHPAVAELLSDVRMGLVVLKPTKGFLESLPIKMFEYMCSGIPVIASDFARFAEVIRGAKCGLLVDPNDARAIAQAIEFLLSHPEQAEEMGRRGREAVLAKYNWSSEERKLIHLYQALLKSPCVA